MNRDVGTNLLHVSDDRAHVDNFRYPRLGAQLTSCVNKVRYSVN